MLVMVLDIRRHLSRIHSRGSQSVRIQVTGEKLPVLKIDCIGLVISIAGPGLGSHSAAALECVHGVQHGFPHMILAFVLHQGVRHPRSSCRSSVVIVAVVRIPQDFGNDS